MKIVIIDNYDSFTYNLVNYVSTITGKPVDVFRNDAFPLEKIRKYDKIIISPGPGIPSEAGLSLQVIREYASSKSILGVCLGHQAIAEVFGGSLINLEQPYHGVKSKIRLLTPDPLFRDLPEFILAGRYHSWVVSRKSLPGDLEINSEDLSGQIMGVSHKKYDVRGVQFHPESIMTQYGYQIIENWLNKY
ncbi:MAG TPA: aminodeoxychorismate/anthranilate synthase component II [Bacteroidetes bacterium]|nr:aminodeoxychorismate/anthranilate synthase component II [Bacteroidota bacterium]